MKKLLSTIEILFVFFIFILPPLFAGPQKAVHPLQIKLSAYSAGMFVSCFFLFLIHFDLYSKKYLNSSKTNIFLLHSLVLTGFGTLVLVSAVFQALSLFLIRKAGGTAVTSVLFPSSVLGWFSLILSIIFMAFNEEFLYRFFIPDYVSSFFDKKFTLIFEVLALLIFAFSHRYLGLCGIFNALTSGLILRLLFVKTKNIWILTGIHFFYNLFTVFISAVL